MYSGVNENIITINCKIVKKRKKINNFFLIWRKNYFLLIHKVLKTSLIFFKDYIKVYIKNTRDNYCQSTEYISL